MRHVRREEPEAARLGTNRQKGELVALGLGSRLQEQRAQKLIVGFFTAVRRRTGRVTLSRAIVYVVDTRPRAPWVRVQIVEVVGSARVQPSEDLGIARARVIVVAVRLRLPAPAPLLSSKAPLLLRQPTQVLLNCHGNIHSRGLGLACIRQSPRSSHAVPGA